MDHQLLLFNLSELFIFDNYDLEDEDLSMWIMSMGEPSVYTLHMMKERGNALFKEGNLALAANLYKLSLNLFCFLGFSSSHDQLSTSSLALSLVLNLAACELKISHYDQACCYCTLVLKFDPVNVKALYRRGIAFSQLNLLREALKDFERAVELDPSNKDANRELVAVVDKLVVNPNGKRIAYPFDPLSSSNKGKKPLIADEVVDMGNVASTSTKASFSDAVSTNYGGVDPNLDVTMVLDDICEVVPQLHAEDKASHMGYANANNAQMKLPCPLTFPDCVPSASTEAHMDSDLSSLTDASEASQSSSSTSSTDSKPPHLRFSNKKRPHSALHLSTQDYDNLLHGNHLGYYHPRSMSVLRVRTLPSKTIQTGTPHEDLSLVLRLST